MTMRRNPKHRPSLRGRRASAGPAGKRSRPAAGAAAGSAAALACPELLAVLQTSQAISGELDLARAAEAVLRAAIEHAGAERGLLALVDDGGLSPAVEARRDEAGTRVQAAAGAASAAGPAWDVVESVRRSGETLVAAGRGSPSPAALGLPLLKRSQLVGVLYLESGGPAARSRSRRAAAGAPEPFTPRRVAALELLAGQAALSLDNARLYAALRAQKDEAARAAAVLQESRGLVQALIDNSTAMIYVKDPEGRYLLVNRRYEELFHLTRASIVGRTDHDLFPPERAQALRANDLQALSAERPIEIEEVIPQDDGPHTYLSIKCALSDAAGRRHAVCSISTDISERKKADALLEGQNRVLEMIAAGEPLEEILASLIRVIEAQSEGMIGTILLLGDDGLHVAGGVAPGLPASYNEALRGAPIGPRAGSCGTAMYRRRPVIVTDIMEDPLWEDYRGLAQRYGLRACWSTPIRSHDSEVLGTFGMYYRQVRQPGPGEMRLTRIATHMASIVIERKHAEEALRASEAHARGLLEAAPDAMVILDREGRIVLVNEQTETLFGYERAEMLGQPAQMLLPDRGGPPLQLHGAAGARLIGLSHDVSGRRRDGSEFPAEIRLSPVASRDGVLVSAAVRDLSERRRLEEQLRQSQKMEAVGRLAGGIAHDFNNLLNVIMGYGDMTLRQVDPGDPLRERIEEIVKAGERAAGLTRQLLAFSRKQVLQPKLLDLNAVVQDVGEMLRRLIGEDIQLVTAIRPELSPVRADPGQIEQVLMNLAVNARDAMPEGGTLMLQTDEVGLRPDAAGHPLDLPAGRYVVLRVVDSGTGMSPEVFNHLFEPFFTTKEPGKGTGLGLATVYGIVEQSGGRIQVASELGRGTRFSIYLPRAEGSLALSPAAPEAELPRGAETVLLVEDEDAVRRFAREVLEQQGYAVLEAGSAPAALELAQHHAGPIHLVVTDVVMPEIGGLELWAQIARLRPHARILFISGYLDGSAAGRDDGNPAFLQKPFLAAALARKVRDVLDDRDRL